MEDEIDLKKYIDLLLAQWKWVVGLAVVGAAVAAALSFFVLPPRYEANAVLVFRPPLYSVNLDSRLQTNFDVSFRYYSALPGLALSDQVLRNVYASLSPDLVGELTFTALRRLLEVEADEKANIILLTAAHEDPEQASEIVNLWADAFYGLVLELYGESENQLNRLKIELDTANERQITAQEAMIAFQLENQAPMLTSQLEILQEDYRDFLAEQTDINRFLQNINSLRIQLAAQPADQPAALADELTVLLLQLQTFNAGSETLQFQITDLQNVSAKTNADTVAILDDLSSSMRARLQEAEAQIPAAEERILALQQEIMQYHARSERLNQDYELAKTIHTTLAAKIAESDIAAQISSFGVNIASKASTPEKPVSPKKVLNTGAGAAGGAALGVMLVLAADYFRPRQPAISA
jgi:uncharacterized protein involved in exopolysaccharide biosynthesis